MTDESKLVGDNAERVALDLLKIIASNESQDNEIVKDREYFLNLYAECLETVQGHYEEDDDDDDDYEEAEGYDESDGDD